MADHLVSRGRAFRKPLRHIGRSAVHPDFVLTDVNPEVVIEVLGMTGNPEYDARMAAKRQHYREHGIPCLEWDAVNTAINGLELDVGARTPNAG